MLFPSRLVGGPHPALARKRTRSLLQLRHCRFLSPKVGVDATGRHEEPDQRHRIPEAALNSSESVDPLRTSYASSSSANASPLAVINLYGHSTTPSGGPQRNPRTLQTLLFKLGTPLITTVTRCPGTSWRGRGLSGPCSEEVLTSQARASDRRQRYAVSWSAPAPASKVRILK